NGARSAPAADAVKTEVLPAGGRETVTRAVDLLRAGEVVGLPTETVYGLAADALSEKAVLKIFQAKSRPRFDPLIVHLPNSAWVNRVAIIDSTVTDQFNELHKRFWPGPLTFIFPRQPIIPDVVTAGLETVAIRLSAHPVFREIVAEFGSPLAAPSANRFGRISPTAAGHVLEELDGLVPLIVDAGATTHGLESTIVAVRNGRIEILRRGPITQEQLAEFGNAVVVGPTNHPEAPGQLPNHYAPRTPLILVDNAATFNAGANQRCGLLGWRTKHDKRFSSVRCLSERQNLVEAATNHFAFLRELDACDLDLIVAERLPEEGLGGAINDRLSRAAN
ncbi:MAG TPA: L-threonylcarbamoyladenylate synthase, partial [Chthoniobacterales bacterium]|nr:L-threonylcarbamoyladenylate synthase [Chthoniobacterales bacterium]